MKRVGIFIMAYEAATSSAQPSKIGRSECSSPNTTPAFGLIPAKLCNRYPLKSARISFILTRKSSSSLRKRDSGYGRSQFLLIMAPSPTKLAFGPLCGMGLVSSSVCSSIIYTNLAFRGSVHRNLADSSPLDTRKSAPSNRQTFVRPHISWPPFWHGISISTDGRLRKSLGLSREGKAITSIMREFFIRIYDECEQRGKRRLNTLEQKCTFT